MGGTAGKLYKSIKDPEDKKKLRASFDAYDKDKNGSLDKAELEAFAEDCLKFLRKDVKSEGFLVKVIVRGVITAVPQSQIFAWAIKEIDTDGDGSASFEEFEAFVLAHPTWEEFDFQLNVEAAEAAEGTKIDGPEEAEAVVAPVNPDEELEEDE